MRVKGDRTCLDCGTKWSYFDTNSITCPTCSSPRSTAANDDPVLHTVKESSLPDDEIRSMASDPIRVLELHGSAYRNELAQMGFINSGELQNLEDHDIAIAELVAASTAPEKLGALSSPAVEAYLIALIQTTISTQSDLHPDPMELPERAQWIFGFGAALVVEAYLLECRKFIRQSRADGREPLIESVSDHSTRIKHLHGEVPYLVSESLIAAARALGELLRSQEPLARERVEKQLEELSNILEPPN